MHKKQNIWLLKPAGYNRGIGIHIFKTFEQLCKIMAKEYGIGRGSKDKVSIFNKHNENHINLNEDKVRSFTFVIQKLIEKPLLFHYRKFDIRMWVVLTSCDSKVYLYQEGYVRTSSKKYNAELDKWEEVQLTNNAIQKHGEEYQKYEEGNIISLDALFSYLS